MSRTTQGVLAAVFCEILYGLSYMVTKAALDAASALALLAWRHVISAVVLALALAVSGRWPRWRGPSLWPAFRVALFSPVLYFVGETYGIARTSSLESGIFLACIPLGAVIASAVLLKERPSRQVAGGMAITLVGALFTVAAVGLSSTLDLPGYGLLLLSVASYGLYSVAVIEAGDFSPWELAFWMALGGALAFGPLAVGEALLGGGLGELLLLPFVDGPFLAAVLYQGVGCTVVAATLSNVAIGKLGVSRTASFIGISTVVSIGAGVLVLNERLYPLQGLGAGLIIFGVMLANGGLPFGGERSDFRG
ncbi:MAG: DMT family transporter [Tissierellia bacterium]|nr:DMT family transporter [Tissierellia bacterium]